MMTLKPIAYFIFLFSVCTWDNADAISARNYTAKLTVSNGGSYGKWANAEFCAEGTYAYGYDMKIEVKHGSGGDDTSLNAIKILCKSLNGDCVGAVSSERSAWGKWVGETKCDGSDVLVAFSLQVEENQGNSDDSAANFIKFKCRSFGASIDQTYELAKEPGYGHYGTYGDFSGDCSSNSAICGIITKLEEPINGDDSALNDVEFYCCT
ncbi:vitelline membrane outer layer protein 1-like [Mercenaria mercenaria]|uniref:vitelline membrane outer layer protein 1-like n=1 Tax=Mercenaria mercenaria TaxID=6596 RepID=UPI00234EB48E|nr:vitelline membrane outer layer protein 1-like [Mercenaria mercenaria]